jgi:hypothetical protein
MLQNKVPLRGIPLSVKPEEFKTCTVQHACFAGSQTKSGRGTNVPIFGGVHGVRFAGHTEWPRLKNETHCERGQFWWQPTSKEPRLTFSTVKWL